MGGLSKVHRRHGILPGNTHRSAVGSDDQIPVHQLRQIPANGGHTDAKQRAELLYRAEFFFFQYVQQCLKPLFFQHMIASVIDCDFLSFIAKQVDKNAQN